MMTHLKSTWNRAKPVVDGIVTNVVSIVQNCVYELQNKLTSRFHNSFNNLRFSYHIFVNKLTCHILVILDRIPEIKYKKHRSLVKTSFVDAMKNITQKHKTSLSSITSGQIKKNMILPICSIQTTSTTAT